MSTNASHAEAPRLAWTEMDTPPMAVQVLQKASEEDRLVTAALNTHGTRAVQKLIETLATREQVCIVPSHKAPVSAAVMAASWCWWLYTPVLACHGFVTKDLCCRLVLCCCCRWSE